MEKKLTSTEIIELKDSLEAIHNIMNANVMDTIRKTKARLDEIQLEIMDFLHAIEKYNFNASEGYKLAKGIQTLRLERRKLKDELDYLDIVESMQRQGISKKSAKHHKIEIHNKETVTKTRGYRIRRREDLKKYLL